MRSIRLLVAVLMMLCAGCSDSEEPGIAERTIVGLSATFESAGDGPLGTAGREVPVEELVGLPVGELRFTSEVSHIEPEFPSFLGIWVVDVGERGVSLTPRGTEPFPGPLDELGDGTYWRIRLDGLGRHELEVVRGAATAVAVDDTLVIELGPGFDPRVDEVELALR